MSVEAIFKNEPGTVQITAAAALASGEIIQLSDGRAGVVAGANARAIGDLASVVVEGHHDVLTAEATTFTIGAPVYWDASASLAIASPGAVDDVYLGVALAACSNAQTRVRVDFNAGQAGAGATGQRGAFVSRAAVIDHADTDEHTLIAAAENPNGLIVLLASAVITEQCGGGSEDQLIVTLYDEDDNVLSVMTPSDAGADAVGDLVQGTLTGCTGATGVALAVIPAGKAAYAKVSQATSGTSVAGAMRVSALVCPLI